MPRGRKRTRTGAETQSTFEKTPALEMAILDLQKRYIETGRAKPAMRDLLIEGIGLLLDREGLPAMQRPVGAMVSTIIEIPKKSGA